MKRIITNGLVVASLLSQTAFANGTGINVGNVTISGGGMQLVGTISTLSLEDKHKAFTYVGWTLIVVGMLLDRKDLIINSVSSQELSGAQVFDAMVRQSKVLVKNPVLIKDDSDIASAAKAMDMNPVVLAQMVVDLDSKSLSADQIKAKYFPKGFSSEIQRHSADNLIALSSLK